MSSLELINKQLIEHQNKRKEMWIQAWAAVASAFNCHDSQTATKWADNALKDFDIRFPSPSISQQEIQEIISPK